MNAYLESAYCYSDYVPSKILKRFYRIRIIVNNPTQPVEILYKFATELVQLHRNDRVRLVRFGQHWNNSIQLNAYHICLVLIIWFQSKLFFLCFFHVWSGIHLLSLPWELRMSIQFHFASNHRSSLDFLLGQKIFILLLLLKNPKQYSFQSSSDI